MRKIVDEYIPFEHKNLDFINGSLNLARQQRKSNSLEGIMASAIIYTNLVEYLAGNLLENLRHMIFLISYHSLHAVFFIKNMNKAKSPLMLGKLHELLSHYEFPDSSDFLSLLRKFSETRNAIFHRLMVISKDELDQGVVDKQFSELQNVAEEILDKYNAIIKGIIITWRNVMVDQPQQDESNKDQLTAQIAALQSQLSALQNINP